MRPENWYLPNDTRYKTGPRPFFSSRSFVIYNSAALRREIMYQKLWLHLAGLCACELCTYSRNRNNPLTNKIVKFAYINLTRETEELCRMSAFSLDHPSLLHRICHFISSFNMECARFKRNTSERCKIHTFNPISLLFALAELRRRHCFDFDLRLFRSLLFDCSIIWMTTIRRTIRMQQRRDRQSHKG